MEKKYVLINYKVEGSEETCKPLKIVCRKDLRTNIAYRSNLVKFDLLIDYYILQHILDLKQ